MKRVLSVLLALVLLCCAVPMTVGAADANTLTFSQLHGYYRTLGRAAEHSGSLFMDNVASGFELYYYGSGDFTLNASVLCSTEGEIAQYLTVYADGVRSRIRIECEKLHTAYDKAIVLAENLAEGYHHIEVYRQTEAQVSSFRADSVTFTGRLLATAPEKPLTIDVIGDSISGGYGCLWNSSLGVSDPSCNHPKYQDGTQSYAFLAGKALGADVRVTQSSGYGCVAGWNGRVANLQTLYPLLNWFRSQSFAYTFDPIADVVVINLGTNDYNTRTNNNLTNAEFKAGAKNLMTMARTYNPNAKVIWCTGMMGTFYKTEITAAVSELGGADNGYYFLELPKGMGGAVSHPNTAQQAAAADVLKNFLVNTILPSDYAAQNSATASELSAAIAKASATPSPSAALTGAIERAQAELAVNTTDGYRLHARLQDIQNAINGTPTAVSLMPKQYISQTPTAADNVSFIWPYYGNADGSVTLYKGGDGWYWPQINTAMRETVDIDETPYLYLEYESNCDFNVSITYRRADGELAYINAANLTGGSATDLPASSRRSMTLNFAQYIRQQGHATDNGLVSLVSAEMFVIGSTDQMARVYACEFTDRQDAPTAISGTYPVQSGVLTNIPIGTTAEELLGAMDHAEYLKLSTANGGEVSGAVATGMRLSMTVDGALIDRVTLSVKGDVSCDGKITTIDARNTILYALEAIVLDSSQAFAANYNNDSEINTSDARLIMLYAINN